MKAVVVGGYALITLVACSSGSATGSPTSSSTSSASGSSGGTSSGTTIASTSYEKACSVTDDCTLVATSFNACLCETCSQDAIAKSASTKYVADVAAARASAQCDSPKNCGAVDCAAQTAVCFQNACTTCSQHPGACQKDLYTRLGGDTGVDALMTQLITNELADVAIASYFFAQTAATTPAGSPTTAQLRLCLRHLLKGNTTDPKIDDYAVTAKNGGFACRSMAAAHACKHVASRDFDKFVATFSSTLLQMVQTNRYNVTSAEQASLTTLFAGTKTDVVDPTRGANDTGFPSPH